MNIKFENKLKNSVVTENKIKNRNKNKNRGGNEKDNVNDAEKECEISAAGKTGEKNENASQSLYSYSRPAAVMPQNDPSETLIESWDKYLRDPEAGELRKCLENLLMDKGPSGTPSGRCY